MPLQAELDTNLFGIIRVTRALVAAPERHAPAAVINVLSVLSWLSLGGGYELSKAAAWSASKALRVQLRDRGIEVSGLHLGFMDTEMAADRDAPKADPPGDGADHR